MRQLPPSFFARDATVVAPELLGKAFEAAGLLVRITEVEAYTQDDPASHSFRGRTARNSPMFGPPGHWYVYFVYGMHHCLNVVTGAEGDGQAVLIRAVQGEGLPPGRGTGPGRLTRTLGIDTAWNGRPAVLHDLGEAPPASPIVTPRIGITKAAEWPRRWVSPPT